MSHNKLNISEGTAIVLSWVTHSMSSDEMDMLRNVPQPSYINKYLPDAHLGSCTKKGLLKKPEF